MLVCAIDLGPLRRTGCVTSAGLHERLTRQFFERL